MNLANDGAMSRAIFDWNYVLWEVRLTLLAAGFFIYLGVFLLAHWLSSWISASYRTLSPQQKVFWNMDITRGLFAVQSCGAGLWALLIDPDFQADQVYSQQKWSWFHCLTAAGFFLLENIVVYVSIIVFRTCDVFSAVHHLFAFGGLLGLIFNIKSGHYLPVMGLLLEMSTPSICMYSLLLRVILPFLTTSLPPEPLGEGGLQTWFAAYWVQEVSRNQSLSALNPEDCLVCSTQFSPKYPLPFQFVPIVYNFSSFNLSNINCSSPYVQWAASSVWNNCSSQFNSYVIPVLNACGRSDHSFPLIESIRVPASHCWVFVGNSLIPAPTWVGTYSNCSMWSFSYANTSLTKPTLTYTYPPSP
ncbi:protein CLN8-like isoform X2 [Gopherus evgoodei]|uniref:protein CLN8-like isoform X2 n=1 Tax=Gopherus evgoodei TaxID=1825980 RepID=UPI0011CF354C|nr:protein CLN8-like isoform X2 [Gopherus evgoodei]